MALMPSSESAMVEAHTVPGLYPDRRVSLQAPQTRVAGFAWVIRPGSFLAAVL
jgi:hypothetical protein